MVLFQVRADVALDSAATAKRTGEDSLQFINGSILPSPCAPGLRRHNTFLAAGARLVVRIVVITFSTIKC